MAEEKKDIKQTEQSQAISNTIKANPLKSAVAPKQESLGKAIEMGEKLKKTDPDQISIGLDKFEDTLAKQRKVILQ